MDNYNTSEQNETLKDGIPESPEDGNRVSAENKQQRISAERGDIKKMISDVRILQPHSLLPRPEAPPGLSPAPDKTPSPAIISDDGEGDAFSVDVQAIGKLIRERSNSFSAAIARRISSFKESLSNEDDDEDPKKATRRMDVTEFNLSGMTVVVKLKEDDQSTEEIDPPPPPHHHHHHRGRISFFSRSNCRDCTAVRRFFREKGLRFVEINVDVYPNRLKELEERTGDKAVPQIFFNERLFGGLVALNSLRNSGEFDARIGEFLAGKCPDDAPAPPVYGFDEEEDEAEMEEEREEKVVVEMVRVLRQRLPIQDRVMKMKMKIVKNCFAGAELVEALIHHLDCGRRKAVEIGKQLAKKHFIHHVFRENDFEDGNHLYRFLEHEPFIPKCFNFRGSTNDGQPKSAVKVGEKLTKIMSAILEAYASEDRHHLDYIGISNSEEFRRYVNLTQELHRINLGELSQEERLAFFMNLYNAMAIHAVIRVGKPEGIMDRRFFSDFQYVVGGYPYSLSIIKNGILRNNRRPPYFFVKHFGPQDARLELAVAKVNPLIHFGLCDGTRSSPTVRFFSPQGIETELRSAARDFFQSVGMEADLEKRTVYLTRIIKWFDSDFGQEKEILKWIMNYLDATRAGLLTHLFGDGGPVNISYKDYDWSINS